MAKRSVFIRVSGKAQLFRPTGLNHRRLRRYVFSILIGAYTNSWAETSPPASPLDASTWKATLKQKPSTGLQMGKLRVQFERTTLDDIRRAASSGEIAHRGQAGENLYWLCYISPGPDPIQRIWVVSDGEMGGPEHHVTGISAEEYPNGLATAECPTLPNSLTPLSFDKHLWLGASKEETTIKVGTPSFLKGAWRSYDFNGKVAGNCRGGGFDLSASLVLHFQNGRANFLRISQFTTC